MQTHDKAYIKLDYARGHAIHRVNQAEYGIRIRVAVPLAYMNMY